MENTNCAWDCHYVSYRVIFQSLSRFPTFPHQRSIIGSTSEHTFSHRHTHENQSHVKLDQNRIFSNGLSSPLGRTGSKGHCATCSLTELGDMDPRVSPTIGVTPCHSIPLLSSSVSHIISICAVSWSRDHVPNSSSLVYHLGNRVW